MKRKTFTFKTLSQGLILFWLLSGAVAGHGELVDRIVAIVNDDCITLSELNEALEPYARQIRDAVYSAEEERQMLIKLRQEMLNTMIDQMLTDQEGEEFGVSISEEEVDRKIEQIIGEQSLTEEALRKSLEAEGYTLEEYRNKIREQMLRLKLINIKVKSKIAITDEEIKEYYDKHKEAYKGNAKYHLATILIRVPTSATGDERADALKRIEAVVEKFKAGGAFDELARQYSEDRTAKHGGDLGLFSIDELSSEFQETVRGMKEGEISPVVKTPQGYQVIMLQGIKNAPGKSIEEATIEIQEKLYTELVERKYKEWFKELRERSYIKIIE